MKWSKDIPAFPGWYWYQEHDCVPVALNLTIIDECLVALGEMNPRGHYRSEIILDDLLGHWAGPCQPPEETA